ncbi:hypothetical protein ACLOJK_003561 [Asimina triloba]
MSVHSQILQRGFVTHLSVSNVLISLYMASDCVKDAELIFQEIPDPDSASWNSLISGLSQNGFFRTALERFQKLRGLDIKITSYALAAAVRACLEDEINGRTIHGLGIKTGLDLDCFVGSSLILMYSEFKDMEGAVESMEIEPESQHYVCMVHLLAAGGRLDEAEAFITSSPDEYGKELWQSFLVACKNLGEWNRGLSVAEKIMRAGPPGSWLHFNRSDLSTNSLAAMRDEGISRNSKLLENQVHPRGKRAEEVNRRCLKIRRHEHYADDLKIPDVNVYCQLMTVRSHWKAYCHKLHEFHIGGILGGFWVLKE